MFRIPPNEKLNYTVDNVCSTGKTPFHKILLAPFSEAIKTHLQNWCMYSDFIIKVDYQPEKFPSLHIKTRIGSILLFGSGKFIFVGYKRQNDVNHLLEVVKHFLGYSDGEDHCRVTAAQEHLNGPQKNDLRAHLLN